MKNKKRVLVLGASGFLGYNISEALSKREDLDVFGTYLTNKYGRINTENQSERLFRIDLTQKTLRGFVLIPFLLVQSPEQFIP